MSSIISDCDGDVTEGEIILSTMGYYNISQMGFSTDIATNSDTEMIIRRVQYQWLHQFLSQFQEQDYSQPNLVEETR